MHRISAAFVPLRLLRGAYLALLILILAAFAPRAGRSAAKAAEGASSAPDVSAQGGAPASEAERAYRADMEKADQQIAAEVAAHSELMKNLEYLTTEIGPRLTGSPAMQKASQWTLERFRAYGIDVHLETTQVAHAWNRGRDTAEIVSPLQRVIQVRSMGWSKATAGEVTGRVYFIDFAANPAEQIEALKDSLKGAIICMGRPATLATGQADNAYDAVITPRRGVPPAGGAGAAAFQERRRISETLAQAGAAAILRDSGKPDSLFTMGGAGGRPYEPSALPSAFLTHEEYSLIYRLAQAGPVTLKLVLKGSFSAGPEDASITVAEIKGSAFPDQRVIVGGHLDSWDLGQGALDNGTGAMATLEAARALKALGWQPKRTLTFILFTGEEEGGVGVRTYLANHTAEVPKMDAVLIDDTGTGRVFSIALENLWETAAMFGRIYQPLQEVFDLEAPEARYYGSSDHVPFLRAGVPAYFCVQEPAGYREAHHSQTDTFDKVIPDQVNEGAAVLAAWAWNVSEYPESLPHHAAEAERREP